ncbi:sigma factor-like helix-turn-helix DNA-binding protein [Streptomyces sp. NPDC044989]|uniref:sigma factor-like helix-turn-helix DNA-binding protein n=1 Tax=Streptomyces sp. NPDC044989 TaxID=3154336 RepID=UPI0034066980
MRKGAGRRKTLPTRFGSPSCATSPATRRRTRNPLPRCSSSLDERSPTGTWSAAGAPTRRRRRSLRTTDPGRKDLPGPDRSRRVAHGPEAERRPARPPRQHKPLALRHIDGLDRETIAELMGITVEGVKKLLGSAVRTLRTSPDPTGSASSTATLIVSTDSPTSSVNGPATSTRGAALHG